MTKQILILVTLFFAIGCGYHKVRIESGDQPLARIKHAVKKAMPIGVRLVSENGREYFSEYYIQRRGRTFHAKKMLIRKYVHVWILGDMRPYKIDVEVVKEKKLKSKSEVTALYEFMSYDKASAKVITKRINKILNQGRKDSNIVDDFRVF